MFNIWGLDQTDYNLILTMEYCPKDSDGDYEKGRDYWMLGI
jgi:hypothetical protein